MDNFLNLYLPVLAAFLTTSLLLEGISAIFRSRRRKATKALLEACGLTRDPNPRPKHQTRGGGYL